MTLSATLRTFSWLARDTFRQARAGGIQWILLLISGLAIIVCASASIQGEVPLAAPGETADFLPRNDPDASDPAKLKSSGVVVASGELELAFGMIRIPLNRDSRSAVHFLELILAGGVADTLGLLLTLIWTAGFLPGFLDTRAITVLLAKPVPRWLLLVGKYVGVLAFVLVNATLFVVGTWLAIGLRIGVWDAEYLYAIVLLVLHFAMFFSVSTLLAVWFRSTVVCVFGSIVFWALAWSINYGRHALLVASDALSPDAFLVGSDLADRSGLLGVAEAGRHELAAVALAVGRRPFQPAFRLRQVVGKRFFDHAVDRQFAAVHRGGVGPFGTASGRHRLLIEPPPPQGRGFANPCRGIKIRRFAGTCGAPRWSRRAKLRLAAACRRR